MCSTCLCCPPYSTGPGSSPRLVHVECMTHMHLKTQTWKGACGCIQHKSRVSSTSPTTRHTHCGIMCPGAWRPRAADASRTPGTRETAMHEPCMTGSWTHGYGGTSGHRHRLNPQANVHNQAMVTADLCSHPCRLAERQRMSSQTAAALEGGR